MFVVKPALIVRWKFSPKKFSFVYSDSYHDMTRSLQASEWFKAKILGSHWFRVVQAFAWTRDQMLCFHWLKENVALCSRGWEGHPLQLLQHKPSWSCSILLLQQANPQVKLFKDSLSVMI